MTPDEWGDEVLRLANEYGIRKAVAMVVERAIREDRAEYVREKREKVA